MNMSPQSLNMISRVTANSWVLTVLNARAFHVSARALAKKRHVNVQTTSGDLFDDSENASDTELIYSNRNTDETVWSADEREAESRKGVVHLRRGVPVVEKWHKDAQGLILPECRRTAFEALFRSFEIGKFRDVRSSSWTHLINMASSEDDLRKVAGVMRLWITRERDWRPTIPELFVQRCETLKCPLFARDVFANFTDYRLPMTQDAAVSLLCALTDYPLEHTVSAVALWPNHGLCNPDEDVVACALLTAKCLQTSTDKEDASADSSDTSRREEAWTAGIQQLQLLQVILSKYADAAAPVLDTLSGQKPSISRIRPPTFAIQYRSNPLHGAIANKHAAKLNRALGKISACIRRHLMSPSSNKSESEALKKDADYIDEWRIKWATPWSDLTHAGKLWSAAEDNVKRRQAAVEDILPAVNWHMAHKRAALKLASLARRSDFPASFQHQAERPGSETAAVL